MKLLVLVLATDRDLLISHIRHTAERLLVSQPPTHYKNLPRGLKQSHRNMNSQGTPSTEVLITWNISDLLPCSLFFSNKR